MTPDPHWQLLERYLAGECAAEEADTVRQWLSADPEARRYVEALQRAMGLDAPAPADWATDAAWHRSARVTGLPAEREPDPAPVATQPRDPRHRVPAWLRTAAAVVLAAGGVGLLDDLAHRPRPTPESAMRQYVTSRGQRLDTRLSDGTRVLLAPASRLGVPDDYGRGPRTVELDGEAYFEVVHDSLRPFAVRARYAIARDLGTRFGVRARADEPAVRVVVADGTVALSVPASNDRLPTLLARGDLGTVDTLGIPTVTAPVDIGKYLAWTSGKLVFDGTPLDQVVLDIGRWYNVDVALSSPSLATKRLTITFDDEPLDHVLDVVSFALNLRHVRVGDRVTFYPIRSAE